MNSTFMIIIACFLIAIIIACAVLDRRGNLNKIKGKKIGNGQYGTADWANHSELLDNLTLVKYEPEAWRKGENLPTAEGTILGTYTKRKDELYAWVDTSDSHTLFVAASSGGKTSSILYPNIEYCAALGLSFFCSDTKGGVFKDFVPVLSMDYDYKCSVIDLRYPDKSDSYNLMRLVNKYMDAYLETGNLSDKANSEAYAKNIGSTIIHSEGFKNAGQNQFFYDTAQSVISGVTLLCAEFSPNPQRHIVSIFKLIRQLMEVNPDTVGKKDVVPQLYLQQLYHILPENHICKDLLAPSATSDFKTMASIIGTAMSKLLSFIDSEIEQLVCFDGDLDMEEFAKGKQAVFFVIDEKMNTRNFMINLIYKQFYGELIKVADMTENNRLDKRVVFWMDEFGTHNAIDGAEAMFSAARSRNVIFNPFIQTRAQLEDKYGDKKAKIIESNCQNLMFGFQSPTSSDAQAFEKIIGYQTVQSGSVSHKSGSNGSSNSSTTYSMIKRPLMFADEITTNLKKGDWILKRIGMNSARMKLLKHEDCGINFDSSYVIESRADRKVEYASRDELMTEVQKKYPQHYYPSYASQPAPPITPDRENQTERTINPEYFN